MRGLHQNVTVEVFLSRSDPMYADVKELFTRYRAESSRVKVNFTDPDLHRARFEMMKSRYGIREGRLPDGRTVTDTAIVVSSQGRNWFVTQDDLVEVDYSGMGGGPELKGWKAEGVLTSAILQVTTADKPMVCFTKGHGEMAIDDFSERGLQHFKEALERDNYQTKAIETFGQSHVPNDCDVVLVVGPTRPFAEEEAGLLRSWVEGGGRLVLALDPLMEETHFVPTGLEGLTERFGVRLDQDVVIETEESHLLPGADNLTFVAADWGAHALAERFKETPLLTAITRSLHKLDRDGVEVSELLKATAKAWGETDLAGSLQGNEPTKGEGDVADGAPVLAMAAELQGGGEHQHKGRLVVVGDADFMVRPLFENPRFVNYDFGMGIVAWLAQREQLISIAPKDLESSHLSLSESQLFWFALYAIVFMPVAAFLLGIFVWLRRRQ